jgi:hypothetical protein
VTTDYAQRKRGLPVCRDPMSSFGCTVSRIMLVAIAVVYVPISFAENTHKSVAQCSRLAERRDRLHAEIERLHAETAMINAELRDCEEGDQFIPPIAALPRVQPSHSTGVAADDPGLLGTEPAAPQADTEHRPPARRGGNSNGVYAVDCWAASSAFIDSSCNCLGEAAHPKLSSRPTIKIAVGGWYGAYLVSSIFPLGPSRDYVAHCGS